MESIIKHFIKTSPFPFIDSKGKIFSKNERLAPIQCQTCTKPCRTYFMEEVTEKLKICPKGFNVYNAEFKDYKLTLVGLLVRGQHGKLPRKKKRSESQIINLIELTNWREEITQLLNDIEESKESCVKDSLAVYHDITPTISLIFEHLSL